MKKQLKRFSKSTLAVLLSVCLLMSCLTVGIIATEAAQSAEERVGAVDNSEDVGATTYRYLWYDMSSNNGQLSALSNKVTLSSTDDNYYTGSFSSNGNNIHFIINNSSSTHTSSSLNSSTTVTVKGSVASWTRRYENSGSYGVEGQLNSGNTYYIGYNVSTNTVIVGSSSSDISGGSSSGGSGETGTAVTDSDLVAVLKGTKIMIYYGDEWGSGTKYAKTSTSGASSINASSSLSGKYNGSTNTQYLAYGAVTKNATYSVSNSSSWGGVSIGTPTAGYMYALYSSGGNNYYWKNEKAPTITWGTSSDTIAQGDGTCSIAATSSGQTGIDATTSVKYFYTTDNTNFYTFDPSNTAGLAAGTYTIIATAYDGNIYVKAATTATLTVNAAETKHAVTFSASPSAGGSVSPATGTEVGESTATTITATPNAGYSFSSWTFGSGITGASTSTASTSITTKTSGNYTVQANFTPNNYKVSYSAASNGTFTVKKTSDSTTISSGTSVPYNTGITVTCTPNTGYQLSSVTYTNASGATTSASVSGNTATFNVPARDTTITVTFAGKPNAITTSANPGGGGNVWVGSTASTAYANRLTRYNTGATVYLRASANAAYNFTKFVVTYADGTTQEVTTNNSALTIDATHFSSGGDGSISVVGYFTAKPTHTITVKTNNVARGTALASVSSAYQGQVVTLTATENTGTFSSWTVNSGGVTVSGNTKSATFTMGSSDVTITANFNEYSANSNFYYNNYGNNGQPASTHYGGRMTEAKINGETYSYYHVTGRTEADQLFTVSYGDPAHNGTVYFVTPDGWTDKHGWDATTIDAQFYGSDGELITTWASMTSDGNYGSDRCFKISIPKGARKVQFRAEKNDPDTSNWPATALFDLNDLADYIDCIYISEYHKNDGGQFDHLGAKNRGNTSKPIADGFFENFNGTNKYTNAFSSGGFNNHNATRGASHSYTKPNNMDESQRGDYYVLVLYKGKTYTINGVTKTISNDPEIIWLPTLPSAVPDDTETVNIYAKNGSLRDSTFNRFTNLANTDIVTDYFEYTEILDSGVYTYTSIEDYNAAHSKQIVITNDVSGYNSTYATMTNVPVGAKIKLRTTLSSNSSDTGSFDSKAFKDTHYLKAYTFNGVTYEVHSANDTGVYEEVWTVRDVNTKSADGTTNLTKNGNTVEVTPIYYMKDNSNCMTFYIDGYDATVQGAWGNLLSVYPYYENKSNSANAFGGYPGQPMLLWGGKYQMEIPLTVDGTATGATVKGLTLHNGYWDLLHRDKDLVCNKHAQTYDYDDFYKIYKEKNPDSIIFDFKYKTTKDNFDDGYDYFDYDFADGTTGTAATYNGSGYNGVELLTDYYGRQVDAFGNLITTNQSNWDTTKTQDGELLFVSTGYKDTYVGEYATLWAVYAPDGDFIGYISPSMLYLSSLGRVAQYTDGSNTASGRMSWEAFSNTYTTLKNNYTGTPVLISYEEEIWNDSKDKANRSDGKWYYANKSDKISANIIIQYNSNTEQSAAIVASKDRALNDTSKWTEDTWSATKGVGGYNNIGATTACSAYFTNTSPYLLGKVASGEQFADSTKSFTFRADSGGDYMFVNWVRYSNGKYYEISEKELAESVMSSNDTYIARFVKSSSGSLKISHVVEQNSTYTGTGTPSVTVTVKSANDTQVFSQTSTDGTPIDISSYIQTKFSGYKINISLSTAPDEDCTLAEIVTSAAEKYRPGTISGNAATVTQFTVEDIIDDSVSNLRYVSHLNTINYIYNYSIVYTYPSRFWGNQSYTVTGSLSSTEPEQIANISGKKGDAKLTTDFIIDKTPYEKNFRQQINWNYTDSAVGDAAAMTNAVTASSGTTYTISATVNASGAVNDSVTAEFILPYNHTSKETGARIIQGDMYETAEDVDPSTATKTNIYDTSYESVTLTTQAYSLFTYDDGIHTGGDDTLAKDLDLIEAPEYLIKDANWHYHHETKTRYFTSADEDNPGYQSFKVGNTKYWLNQKPSGAAGEVLTSSSTATFNNTTYNYAVLIENTGGYTQELYQFVNVGQENVQYTYTSWVSSINGIIHDEAHGGKYYFTRWDVYNTKGEFVASCYNRKFTFSGYDNYVIRPIYETAPDANGNNPNNYASATGTSSSGTSAEITFLGDTRNQWNSGGAGDYRSVTGKTDGDTAGDKLIQDFALAYSYQGKEIQKIPSSENVIKIGMIIEKLGALDSASGTKVVDPSYYANKYKDDANPTAIATALSSGGSISTATGHTCVNSKIGANVDGWGTKFGTSTTTALNFNSVIDNFNRLQWFYTFNNTKTNGEIGNTNNANFAYRAWAYIIVDGTATVSSTPTYFTLYDSASR